MEVAEDLDREVVVERAEELRNWLGSLEIGGRTLAPLERELAAIVANDPGGYINGRRPLAGLTVEQVIAELQRPNAGAVGQVRGVGDRVVDELRSALGAAPPAALPPTNATSAAAPKRSRRAKADGASAAPAPAAEAAPAAPKRSRRAKADDASAAPAPDLADTDAAPDLADTDAAPDLADTDAAPDLADTDAAPAPRRRGRPRRSESTAAPASKDAAPAPSASVAATDAPADAPAPRRRGRPRRSEAAPAAISAPASPAAVAVTPAQPTGANSGHDRSLERLIELWRLLHPQGRRAVVLFASTLVYEEIAG